MCVSEVRFNVQLLTLNYFIGLQRSCILIGFSIVSTNGIGLEEGLTVHHMLKLTKTKRAVAFIGAGHSSTVCKTSARRVANNAIYVAHQKRKRGGTFEGSSAVPLAWEFELESLILSQLCCCSSLLFFCLHFGLNSR